MSKYLAIFTMMAVITAAPIAMAETIKKGMIGCITEDLLTEAIRYASKSDMNGLGV